jgi:hypothetical protein
MLTNMDYFIIKQLRKKKCVYDKDEKTLYVHLSELSDSDLLLIKRKSKYLNVQYIYIT